MRHVHYSEETRRTSPEHNHFCLSALNCVMSVICTQRHVSCGPSQKAFAATDASGGTDHTIPLGSDVQRYAQYKEVALMYRHQSHYYIPATETERTSKAKAVDSVAAAHSPHSDWPVKAVTVTITVDTVTVTVTAA